MATVNKDFKVKNGLIVTDGGSFGGAVEVAEPTLSNHATTKSYVDNLVGSPIVPTQSLPPENPADGQLYFDTDSRHMLIYSVDEGDWIMIATLYDTANLPQHIHDTSIDGTGLIVSIYQDGGFYDSFFTSEQDAGYYDMNTWAMEWNGGIAIDNFN